MSEQEMNYSDVELKALERGWKPKEEWEGSSSEWVSADEFNRRGELMDTISTLNKRDKSKDDRIDKLETALKELGEHNKKIAEKEYERALATLKKQKVQALEMDDHERVVEVEDKIEEVKEAKRKFEQSSSVDKEEPRQPESNPVVEQWKQNNQWYTTNLAMRGAADAFANDYITRNPSAVSDAEAVLNYVDQQIKKEFPDMEARRRPSGTVDTDGTASRGKPRKFSSRNLNDDQRRIGETLVRAGAFEKLQDYVDQLAELGEIN